MHRRVLAFWRLLLVLFGSLTAAGCGSHSNPTGPSPEPPTAPGIACPAPSTATSIDGDALAVTFAPPTTHDGSPPLTIGCTPPSGSPFPLGSSNVTCTVIDASQRTASCSFTITVVVPPRIGATRFVAFGDSVTEGKLALRLMLIDAPAFSYPFQLKLLLTSRYVAQQHQIDVLDEGVGGETTDVGIFRLPRVLDADKADALLLQEGVNDLNLRGSVAIPIVVNNLRAIVREARSRGLVVFVGTLLPERPGGRSAAAPSLVAPTNDQIRAMTASERAVLVDLYDAFGGVAGSLIGDDGLHPNEAGYRKIAETFFDAIRDRLELSAP